MFASFIILISGCVIIYREDYIKGDESIDRFKILVILFVCSILLFVTSYNLVFIILGWDGLGLVSFCLVIYYQNNRSLNSGMVTVLRNRLGDVGILMAIVCLVRIGDFIVLRNLSKGLP
ncbi:hypothetical protein JQN64_24710 [Escherichia coli]|nr:hypothetical protein [Escherichia coli]